MPRGQRSETKIILFTDLVNSTALLQRVGDEEGRRVVEAHREMLHGVVSATSGDEVKWLGDGLMVAFASAADAVRCAVAMQQTSRRQASGERLQIRVGLHVGEALRSEADYFGTPVVIARRLCDHAKAGQILCTELVADLLASRRAYSFRGIGEVQLKGIDLPVAACEVTYEQNDQFALLSRTPFTGRTNELAKLRQCFEDTRSGQGGVVMLVGEPGIGKTRTAEEFLAIAAETDTEVLRGACYEGETGSPFGPFAEALKQHVVLRTLAHGPMGLTGAVTGPADTAASAVANSPPLAAVPEHGRFELFERVAQLLVSMSLRAPVVLMVDDLQWADDDTILMFRHVSRAITHHRVLLVGAYRDVDLDRQHPLGRALVHLRRETRYVGISMKGLPATEVGQLLQKCANDSLPYSLVAKIAREAGGNPFFVREILLHLIEEGRLRSDDGRWVVSMNIDDIGIPEGVRQVVTLRLSRLAIATNQLLSTAAAFQTPFTFELATTVAELSESDALDALDEALAAGFLRRSNEGDRYEFSHALVAHTLYAEQNPSRQVRLHRRIAEAMEHSYAGSIRFAGELAYQYHRSLAIPGGDAAVPYALAAADQAAQAYAWDELIRFLKIALDVLEEGDPRRRDVLARLGLTLPSTAAWQDTLSIAKQVGEILAQSDGRGAAVAYLADVVWAMVKAGGTFDPATWALAAHALQYVPEHNGYAWARLACVDQWRRDAEEADRIGIPLDNSVREELRRVIAALSSDEQEELARHQFILPANRQDVLARFPWHATYMTFWAGEYERSLALWNESVSEADRQSNAWAKPDALANLARCQLVLGDFAAARRTLAAAEAIGVRPTGRYALTILSVRDDMRAATDDGWTQASVELEALLKQANPDQYWAFAAIRAAAARAFARIGRRDDALKLLPSAGEALDRASGSAPNYPRIACNVAEVIWLLWSTAEVESIERNIREKVLEPDFRYPMVDARLSLARLSAVSRRYEEASEWFGKARAVLDEQGARPLRAIVDHDEAVMYKRRGLAGDTERAAELKALALGQFRALGMTGWVKRAAAID